jgi:AraC family 4-hydroxyphenylacetate 3-monooxygenase operon regulatory protein
VPLVEAVKRGNIRHEALARGQYPGRKLPEGALPGLKVIGYWDAEEAQNWGLAWHRNEGLELTFLENGVLDFAAEGIEHRLQPSDLTISRPWELHRVGNPNISACRLHFMILDVGVRRPNQDWKWPPWLILSEPDLAELTDILRHTSQWVWTAPPELRGCFQKLALAVKSDSKGSCISTLAVRINELLLQVLTTLRTWRPQLDQSLSGSHHTVQLFLADLRSNPEFLALHRTTEEMASACGLKPTRFVELVRSQTNLTPLRFLNNCRLEFAAKLLLEQDDASITDVALTSGFSSSQYFATTFNLRYGCSPREFRRKATEKLDAVPFHTVLDRVPVGDVDRFVSR